MMPWYRRKREAEAAKRSVTVSYCAEDRPLFTSRVGYGPTFDAALADADRQLPVGIWRRLVVSQPESLLLDVSTSREARLSRSTLHRGENVTVRVDPPAVTVLYE